MDGMARRAGGAGQATVEHIGLVLVLGLVLGALALWAVREMRPPDRPPDVLGAAARPLDDAARPARDLAAWSWAMRAGHVPAAAGRGPVARVLRAVVQWRLLAAEGDLEAGRGFLERVRERLGEALDDPGRIARDLADPDPSDPRRLIADRWDDLVRYLGRLRGMPAREAFLRASRDAGRLAADLVVARAVRAARRAVTDRLARRPPPPPPRRQPRRRTAPRDPPPAPAPAAPRAKPGEAASPAGSPRTPRRG